MNIKIISKIRLITSLYLVVGLLMLSGGAQVAYAAAITSASDTMSSVKADPTVSSHVIKFTTPTGAAESTDTIIITFPSDFNFTSKTIGTVTFTHGASTGLESTETLAASPSGTAWGAVFSGTESRILTLTAPTDGTGAAVVAASDKIIITYNSTNSINASVGSYAVAISGTFGDSGNITVNIISDDQVAVTATVAQSLTFSISDNTIEFGTLSASDDTFADDSGGNATEVSAHNLIVGTNAGNGYTMTLNGNTLTTGSFTIATTSAATATTVGSEQFGLRLSASGGSGTVSAPYATASQYAFDSLNFPDQIASASGASANTTYSAYYIANIGSATEAGSYSATLTYVATANF